MRIVKIMLQTLYILTCFLLFLFFQPFPFASAWQLGGFKTPESVLKDPETSFYYVSNINGTPTAKDDNGFISKIDSTGKMINLRFIDGASQKYILNAPKGLTIVKRTLYVTDIDFVRAYDLGTGENILNIDLRPSGAKFLNDIVADQEGSLYVSDTATNTIYKIDPESKKVHLYFQSKDLQGPNGLMIHPETGALFIVSWNGGKIFILRENKLQELTLPERPVNLDGIDRDQEGNIYFSDFTAGKIYKLTREGKLQLIAKGLNQPADISLDRENKLLLIPEFNASRVKTIPVGGTKKEAKLILPGKGLKEAFSTLGITPIDPPYPMMDFTLESIEGGKINTRNLRGKFLWLNFWATWCSPCRIEMPSMQKLWKKFGNKNFTILAVDLKENEEKVRLFIKQNGYTFPVVLDREGKIGSMYGIRGIPTSFFIDPQGKIIGVAIGAREWMDKSFYSFLEKLSKTALKE